MSANNEGRSVVDTALAVIVALLLVIVIGLVVYAHEEAVRDLRRRIAVLEQQVKQ